MGGHVLLRTLFVATLQRSLVLLLRYMLLQYAAEISGVVAMLCYMLLPSRDLWCCCYGVCTKGWGEGGVGVPGVVATLYVATLQRSLVLLLRCVHEGVGWGGHVNVPATSYVICCYAAEISGVVDTLYVATLQRSLVVLLRYMLLR